MSWDGEWESIAQLNTTFSHEKGLTVYEVEVYQHQTRNPYSDWPPEEKSTWKDVVRDRERERKREKEREGEGGRVRNLLFY